ncbi:MAG: protein-L-isoaspartate(D-aspartate) O-methyltransferase [Chloroflexota bacterium]|nr:protein-L-isoaspartate(D-aspartate) O-methyltransferase [Chloroflexota bacterium]
MSDFKLSQMLEKHVKDKRIVAAMKLVPRHIFVPEDSKRFSYEDTALNIGHNQTTSQPSLIAMMLSELSVRSRDTVLEIGSGSGYVCAILSNLCSEVIGVERIPELLAESRTKIAKLGITNISLNLAEKRIGLRQKKPFDAIIVSAALPRIPFDLLDQLSPLGRLVCPVGDLNEQSIILLQKHTARYTVKSLVGCKFVPFIGESGWSQEEIG